MRESKRGRRRRQTESICRRRLRHHERLVHFDWDTSGTCVCDDVGIWWWAKRTPWACNCRKRLHGRPRVAAGMCDVGARNPVYRRRNQVRELRHLIVDRGYDPDSDEVALLSNPSTRKD